MIPIVLLLLMPLAGASSPADKLDPRYVSQLRVELRNVQRPEQCLLFWRGLSEKLQATPDYRAPPADGHGAADLELLADLSRMLNFHRAYHKLGEFVDECAAVLRDLPRDKVASHTFSQARALELPAAAASSSEVEQLKKQIQTLQEELASKDKLARELEAQNKLKLDKLNAALLAREQQLEEATKARDQVSNRERQLCKEAEAKLWQQQLEVARRQRENQSREELGKLRREMDDKSKALEQRIDLLAKEKEQLVKEIEGLRKQSGEKCSAEAQQRRFQEDRKDFIERIERLEAKVKAKDKQVELERERCAKKEKSRKKCQLRDEPENKQDVRSMMRLYDRLFFDNSQPLDPHKTLEFLGLLEKMLKGQKGPELKSRYKTVDRFISITNMKPKRCTGGDWAKLREMIDKHMSSSVSVREYLRFWFARRQDYCSRSFPPVMHG